MNGTIPNKFKSIKIITSNNVTTTKGIKIYLILFFINSFAFFTHFSP